MSLREYHLKKQNDINNPHITENLDYAIYWLLIQYDQSSSIETKEVYGNFEKILLEIIFKRNNILFRKINNIEIEILYCDINYFNLSNSLLYQSISNSQLPTHLNVNNTTNNTNNTNNTKVYSYKNHTAHTRNTSEKNTSEKNTNEKKKEEKIIVNFDEINNILQATQELQENIIETNKPVVELIEQDEKLKKTNIDVIDCDLSPKQLEQIEEYTHKLVKTQEILNNSSKTIENKIIDLDCDVRFNKHLETKKKEQQKEQMEIFKSDLSIYNKIIKQIHEKIENFDENNIQQSLNLKIIERFVPLLFEYKYYLIFYLKYNGFFENEDLNNPSIELFKIYYMLLSMQELLNNSDTSNMNLDDILNDVLTHDEIEDNTPLINNFIEYLPQHICTEKSLFSDFEQSTYNEMFGNDIIDDLIDNEDDEDIDCDDTCNKSCRRKKYKNIILKQ